MSPFWYVVLLAWWTGFIVPAGIMASIGIGGIVWVWLAGNLFIGIYFNKARKHSEPEAYSDKPNPNNINSAIERWVQTAREKKRDESST